MKKILFCLITFVLPIFVFSQNVGIGTVTPIQQLHVEGTGLFNAPGSSTGSILFSSPVGHPGMILNSNDPDLYRSDIRRTPDGLDFAIHNAMAIPPVRMTLQNDGILTMRSRGGVAGGAFGLLGAGGAIDWFIDNNDGLLRFYKPGYEAAILSGNGVLRLGIGSAATVPSGYRLVCRGGVIAERVKVAVYGSAAWADYVFDENYPLQSLEEVKDYIKTNHHLPSVPSAAEMVETGNDLGATDAILLAKIEELYLHVIQLNEEIKRLKAGSE